MAVIVDVNTFAKAKKQQLALRRFAVQTSINYFKISNSNGSFNVHKGPNGLF